MPHITANGVRLNYRCDGPESAPVLVLSNSLGTSLAMWDTQLPAFTERFRVLRYDARGHGQSEVPAGDYTIEDLGRDVVGLLDALGLQSVQYCGLSIGGLTGQWLALNAPNRFKGIVLCSTAARIGSQDTWNARIALVREKGMAEVAAGTLSRWFTAEFIERRRPEVDAIRAQLLSTPIAGYAGSCAAVRDADFRELLPAIRMPLLVIAGSHDATTTVEDGRFLARSIPGAQLMELPAAHLSNIEARAQFDDAVLSFLGTT